MKPEDINWARELDQEVYRITGGGAFTEPSEGKPGYRCRDLMNHCREKGIEPSQLSPQELKLFEVPTKNHEKAV